ncbi:unnamed protein product [Orchesella dallaii]|uniref:Uncharacterized protein n=1 Tax=Orchesella dallaii TaxID=48710 RepID=A0ABP1QFL2_9HEXA
MSSLTNHPMTSLSKSCSNFSSLRFSRPERVCPSSEPRSRRKSIRFDLEEMPMTSSLLDISRSSLVDYNGQPMRSILKNSLRGSSPNVAGSSGNDFLSRKNLVRMTPLVRERIYMQHADADKVFETGPTSIKKKEKVGVDMGVNTEVSIPPSPSRKRTMEIRQLRQLNEPSRRKRKTLREIISAQPIEVQDEMNEILESLNLKIH